MEVSSFSSRRPAAGALPAFTLPPPNSDVPRSTADGLSPSLSSVHTTSSQASQPNMQQYTYQQNSQQGWSNSSTSPYGPQSHHTQPASHQSQQNAFGPRTTGMYGQNPMSFPNQRSSQSPATGAEGLPAPPMDHSPYQVSGHDAHSSMSSAAPSHAAIMSPTQPHTPSTGGQMEYSYSSRAPSNASYYTASPAHPQGGFSTYGAHQSPPLPSPTSAHDSRGLHSQSMGSYNRYPYNSVGMGGGPVMSNIHQPGGQMSMIPGMGVGQNYGGQHMMYGHGHPPAAQSERPFKCDQCVQSFSRNHDLKRHKRIHLAVKPFPCNFCSKSFSRKDALKRHRLVKGCEAKSSEGGNADESQDRNGAPGSVSGGSEQAPRPAM